MYILDAPATIKSLAHSYRKSLFRSKTVTNLSLEIRGEMLDVQVNGHLPLETGQNVRIKREWNYGLLSGFMGLLGKPDGSISEIYWGKK